MSLGGVFEHHHAFGRVVVHGQVEAAIEGHRGAVRAVELGERRPTFDARRITGHRDDVLGDDVLGEEVEEMVSLDEAGEAGPG